MKRIILILGVLSLVFAAYLFVGHLFTENDKEEKVAADILKKKYPILETKDIISGIVADKKLSTNFYYKGCYLIKLENGIKFALLPNSENLSYKIESNLSRLIQINDSIVKDAYNDSIFIYRDGTEYYFILGKIINRN